ncbi:DUF4235 domain-containing protein [Gandjariella thermophila]|uniref:DUF4235 domain-containing protein n=1 Tax=Gandjariella thermophila TaxID=1931992 RepID=A0A4D4J3B9_9PSEU|nr:DUF4235 domain-containing protein [Gandjariella thermophila]GDY30991.1 hypothetical protein GTS_26240 [Gandjariella thermophila]
MTKLLYKPFGMLFSVLGGLTAGALFKRLWRLVTGEEETPTATRQEYGWREVLLAAMLEGAVFGLVKAAVDRAGAVAFSKVAGRWPTDR